MRSAEGERLRERAAASIGRPRAAFEAEGLECYGEPPDIVPVGLGCERRAKWTGRALEENGLIANLVECPAAARGKARFHFRVRASHTAEQTGRGADIFRRAPAEAKARLAE